MNRRVIIGTVLTFSVVVPAVWTALRVADTTDGSAATTSFSLDERNSLRGLQSVGVVVSNIQAGLEAHGITEKALRADVERLLRKHGIKVVSYEESYGTPGRSCLAVTVGAVDIEDRDSPKVAVNIDLLLATEVALVRDSSVMCLATTWGRSQLESVNREDLRLVLNSVESLVVEFIEDHFAVNPKASTY